MLGLKKKSIEVAEEVELQVEKPKAHLRIVEKIPIEEYEELANRIGFNPGQLIQEKLLRFLELNDIPIFNSREVGAYLDQMVKPLGKKWVWKPLREKDKTENWGWSREGSFNGFYWPGNSECGLYDNLVPYNILQKVDKIEKSFPDTFKFFVTDYVSLNPDPFIMMTSRGVENIIFGVWDEPSFGINLEKEGQ